MAAKGPARASLRYAKAPLSPRYQWELHQLLGHCYFLAEVAPHVADAWIDAGKVDAIDGGIGIVGYEIPFNRHFYTYIPPRDLAEIDAELDAVSVEIMALLQEVHV